MGQTRRYANLIGLRQARPRLDAASTRFALVVPGRRYLLYQPQSGPFSVRLVRGTRSYDGHWFDPVSGRRVEFRGMRLGGNVTLHPPWRGPAVVFLRVR